MVLGDGNLTFSKCLAKSLGHDGNFRLIATTFLTLEELNEAYGKEKITSIVDKLKENKNVIIIDNRERLNYLEQHIPGAINIPYRTLATDGKILRTKEGMKNLLKNRGISEDAEIITYCGSVGTLSGLAYYALKSIGLQNVKLYVHSFKEWKSLEKPIDKQENANYWDLSAE